MNIFKFKHQTPRFLKCLIGYPTSGEFLKPYNISLASSCLPISYVSYFPSSTPDCHGELRFLFCRCSVILRSLIRMIISSECSGVLRGLLFKGISCFKKAVVIVKRKKVTLLKFYKWSVRWCKELLCSIPSRLRYEYMSRIVG